MEQDEVVRALAEPAAYPHQPAVVAHVQTHISHVFLAGGYVYKLKKAVAFPFLDFSTPEARHHWCEEEVRLNARLGAGVYLGVVPVVRTRDGAVRVGGDGAVLDHVVWMRRLPDEHALPALLARGGLDPATMDALAARLVAFHAAAAADAEVTAEGAPARLEVLWRDTLGQAARFAGAHLAPEDHAVLADAGPTFVARHAALLQRRVDGGRIVEGHGDLRAEHVYVLDAPLPAPDGRPPLPAGLYVVDCVEFSRRLRALDVASDLAFLVMDLERLGHARFGARLVDAYVHETGDRELRTLLPFYVCYRACVRGLVSGLTADDPAVSAAARADAAGVARAHFALALRWAWRAAGPAVLVSCGRSATGKTALASALADATGFVHLSTDVLRAEVAPPGPARYDPATRHAVYVRLAGEAERHLAAGVIADGTFLRAGDRRLLADVAARRDAACLFLTCRADDAIVRARMAKREQAPPLSDARWETYLAQAAEAEPPGPGETSVEIDTGHGIAAARAVALRAAWEWRRRAR